MSALHGTFTASQKSVGSLYNNPRPINADPPVSPGCAELLSSTKDLSSWSRAQSW